MHIFAGTTTSIVWLMGSGSVAIFAERLQECDAHPWHINIDVWCASQFVQTALRKLYFHFLSNWMVLDHVDSFPFDFEPNGILFGSKLNGKLSPRSYPIQYDRKWKYSFLSVKFVTKLHVCNLRFGRSMTSMHRKP